jgi:hypothetical protein
MAVSFLGSQAVESGGTASSRARVLSSSASANTKGVYGTAHVTATAYPTAWAQVFILRPGAAADFLVDVAVGAASSEQVVIANLPYSVNNILSPPMASFLLPLHIPAGSRISSRVQATANTSIECQVICHAPMFGGERGLGQVETCGAVTGTSLGTSVDPGGTASTKGTPSVLLAATTFPYKWVCVSINHTNTQTITPSWTVDIMVGAGGSEVVVVPDLCVSTGSASDTNPAIGLCFPCSIPAGSRVSARAQCSSNASPDRLLEIVLHGVG